LITLTLSEPFIMKSDQEFVYVALGSNLGDREAVFAQVIDAMEAEPTIELRAASPVFETDPFGPGVQGRYLNAVLHIATARAPLALLDWLQGIEVALGRDRSDVSKRWAARVIDLDILFYGKLCLESERLVIPHPRAHERSFVLMPMAELAPEYEHPKLGETIGTLAQSLADQGSVRLHSGPSNWPAND